MKRTLFKTTLTSCNCLQTNRWLKFIFSLLLLSFLNSVSLAQSKQWDKTIGGSASDGLTSLQQTSDGGYILGGTSFSDISGDKTEARRDTSDNTNFKGDYWIVKLNAAGQKEWDKTFGGSGRDYLASIQQTSDGGYILGGTSNSPVSGDKTERNIEDCNEWGCGSDYWVIKLDAFGTKVWDKTFGGNRSDYLSAMQQTSDGGYILGGTSDSPVSGDKTEACWDLYEFYTGDYWLVKLDAAGNKEWDKTIGAIYMDNLNSLRQTSDGGYILGGTSDSPTSGDKTENTQSSLGETDFWVVKLDAVGQKEWDRTLGDQIGYEQYDELSSVSQTSDGGYILGGSSLFDRDGFETTNDTDYDCWVVKLNATGQKQWDRTLGGIDDDFLTSVQQASDGRYILGGTSYSGISGDKTAPNKGDCTIYGCTPDFWIVKLGTAGNGGWDKTFGGNDTDGLSFMQQTNDGGYILGGSSNSPASGDKSKDSRGSYDYWIVKIKEEDVPPPPVHTTWNLRYGGSGIDRFTVVIRTKDGGYLSGGYSNSVVSGDKSQGSRGGADYWIVKTDKNGAQQWDARYGGPNHDYLNRIIPTQDGGYLLAGSSTSGSGGDKTESSRGNHDYWIVKISSTGVKQWDKTYGGSGFEDLKKVNQLSNGDYLLAGVSDSPVSGEKSQKSRGGRDYWLLQVSSTGEKRWDKRYGGSADEHLESFTKTSGGGFLLAGSSASGMSGDKTQASRGGKDYWLVSIDKAGKQLWDQRYGGSQEDALYSVGITKAGGYFVAGHSASTMSGDKSQVSQGSSDYWMLQLKPDGSKLWDKSFGGSGTETLRSIIQLGDGGYVLAGSSDSPVSGAKTQASQGGMDYWLVKTDAQGEKEYDQRYGGSGTEEFRYIERTENGGLLLGGRSESGVSGDKSQPSQGQTDYWLVKVAPVKPADTPLARVADKVETKAELSLSIYPNPAVDQVTVSFTLPQTQLVSLKVYDQKSRPVATLFRGEVEAGQAYNSTWSAKQAAPGLYILKLQTPNHISTRKLVLTK